MIEWATGIDEKSMGGAMREQPGVQSAGGQASRRQFLRLAAAGMTLPAAPALLAACGTSSGGGTQHATSKNAYGTGGIGGAPYPLARPSAPVTWNILADNPPIKSGLAPEKGPLRVFWYNDYIYKNVLNAFAKRHGKAVQTTVFTVPEEMVSKVQADPSAFDLIVTVTLDNVGKLIAGKLIQPLNHSYLPHFGNLWKSYQDPFYDRGCRYTVPYIVYTTGIAWRNDLVKANVPSMANPYDIFWDTRYAHKVEVLNGSRDLLALGLLENRVSDVNTNSQAALTAATTKLLQGVRSMSWKFNHTDYSELTVAGEWYVHETWSGQVAYYKSYLPKGLSIDKFSYLWPAQASAKRPALLQNDVFAIPSGARNPVLAHALIDTLLQESYAIPNYGYEGYQPPLNFLQPDRIVAMGLIPKHLANIIITEDMFPLGVAELEMAPATTSHYQQLYQQVTGGAGGA
jgi:spermidine/putrescine transport system substrate-binding protein